MDNQRGKDEPPAKKSRVSALPDGKAQLQNHNSSSASSERQVDAHVLEFLTKILKSQSNTTNVKEKNNKVDNNTKSKETTVSRKPLKEKRDVGTQTDPVEDEDDEDETEWEDDDDTQSNFGDYGRRTPMYSDSTNLHGPRTPQYKQGKGGKIDSKQIQVEFERWVKDYEKWFKDTFGDVRGLETPGPQQQEDQRQLLESMRQNNNADNPPQQSLFSQQTNDYQSFANNYEWINQLEKSNNLNQMAGTGGFPNPMNISSTNSLGYTTVGSAIQSDYYSNTISCMPPVSMSAIPGGFLNPISTMHFPVHLNPPPITSHVRLAPNNLIFSGSTSAPTMSNFAPTGSVFMQAPTSMQALAFGMLPPVSTVVPHSTIARLPNMFNAPPVPMPTIPAPVLISIPTVVVRQRLMPPPPPPKTPNFPRLAATRTPRSFIGPWGPLLRYGHYGIFSSREDESPEPVEPPVQKKLNENEDSDILGIKSSDTTLERPPSRSIDVMTDTIKPLSKEFVSMRVQEVDAIEEPWSLPPQPPPNVFYPKQSMICTLQMRLRGKARELAIREQDPKLQHTVNYTTSLREIVQSGIGLPVLYLYTRIGKMPPKERAFYLGASTVAEGDGVDNDSELPPMDCIEGEAALKRMYVCDLLIGDVLIAQSIADWKRRAREAAARQAFAILSQPSFIVGSTRYWCNTEYLVVSVSDSPRRIPVLPPFLSDPTEPLWKKDRYINEASSVENFEIINPKTLDEFWLYMADSKELIVPEQLLAKSADFSQMMMFYEMDILRTGQFAARVYLDCDIGAVAEAPTLLGARKLAAKNLVDKLLQKQPVVSLRPDIQETNEDAFVESLMWGKSELEHAIAINDLPEHIDIDCYASMPKESPNKELVETVVDKGEVDKTESSSTELLADDISVEDKVQQSEVKRLKRYVEAYACSALITPLYFTNEIVSANLWPDVRSAAAAWGLMTQRRPNANNGEQQLIVCKRIPMPRLKKTLLENGFCGVFELKERGDLSEEALSKLEGVLPVVLSENDSDNGPLNDNAASGETPVDLEIVKKEFLQDEDCFITTTEINTKHNPIEILDDLPKAKIPGIDF